jgi:hypothetical protein
MENLLINIIGTERKDLGDWKPQIASFGPQPISGLSSTDYGAKFTLTMRIRIKILG